MRNLDKKKNKRLDIKKNETEIYVKLHKCEKIRKRGKKEKLMKSTKNARKSTINENPQGKENTTKTQTTKIISDNRRICKTENE